MKKITLFALLFPLLTIAQETGIHFEQGASWEHVKAKAKAENKFIFVFCYITSSEFCQSMNNKIFPLEVVGDAINGKFISVKAQFDVTHDDNEEVRNWYADSHYIIEKYGIKWYPTYLFFNSNGILVHRAVNSGSASVFLSKAKNALNPETQYYTLLQKYKTGQKDTAFLHKAALAAREANENVGLQNIMTSFLHIVKEGIYTKENLEFLNSMTNFSSDAGFSIEMEHADKVDALLGKNAAEEQIANILIQEELDATKPETPYKIPNWLTMSAFIDKYYANLSSKAVAITKLKWYENAKDWSNYQIAVDDFIKQYATEISIGRLNEYARNIFLHSNDTVFLKEALSWSGKCCKDDALPIYLDTYANLLYKLGQKEEAILWEQNAISQAAPKEQNQYRQTLNKMKSGQKSANTDFLVLFTTDTDLYGYRNLKGDTVIQLGKYSICYTDTFRTYAIVHNSQHGFVAIDRQEQILFELFPFDNGPDNTSDGLFRIIKNDKIGYADSVTGKIVILPEYDGAYPFKNGIAKVAIGCKRKQEGEHWGWTGGEWFFINKTGKRITEIERN